MLIMSGGQACFVEYPRGGADLARLAIGPGLSARAAASLSRLSNTDDLGGSC